MQEGYGRNVEPLPDQGAGYRGLLVAITAAVAVTAAVWVGILFSRFTGSATWISPVLLVVAVILSAWAILQFLVLTPAILHFVRCGRINDQPIGFVIPSLIAFVAIILFSTFGVRSTDQVTKNSLTIVSAYIPIYGDTPPEPISEKPVPVEPARDFFMIPFSTDEGRSTTCSDDDPAFGDAQHVPDAIKPVIAILANGLAACYATDRLPEIDVRGFASSSGFRSCSSKIESEKLNLLLAERRRRSVIEAVRAKVGADHVRIYQEADPRRWPTIEEMRRNVRIVDQDGAGYSTVRGNLSRRAEIVITNKGGCEEIEQATKKPAPSPPAPGPK